LAGRDPAVDVENLASHEISGWRDEEHHRSDDIARLADAADRNARLQLRTEGGIVRV